MKRLWSIFTGDDMSTCFITGRTDNIEIHHVFGGRMGLREKSEKYGFVVPLTAEYHVNGSRLNPDVDWKDIDWKLKRNCEAYFLENYGTREDWYREFGRYYDYEIED